MIPNRYPSFRHSRASLRFHRFPRNHALPLLYRLLLWKPDVTAADPLARSEQLACIEAALLLADEPLSARRLAAAAGLTNTAEARRLVARLAELLVAEGSSFVVEELAGGFQLLTKPEYFYWLSRLRRVGAEARLSPAMLETLAVVAYRQPINRADIEAVRGVQSSEMLRQLMERGLLRIAGREESLGRPVLYATTRKFLQVFGLTSLRDLPEVESMRPPQDAGAADQGE